MTKTKTRNPETIEVTQESSEVRVPIQRGIGAVALDTKRLLRINYERGHRRQDHATAATENGINKDDYAGVTRQQVLEREINRAVNDEYLDSLSPKELQEEADKILNEPSLYSQEGLIEVTYSTETPSNDVLDYDKWDEIVNPDYIDSEELPVITGGDQLEWQLRNLKTQQKKASGVDTLTSDDINYGEDFVLDGVSIKEARAGQ